MINIIVILDLQTAKVKSQTSLQFMHVVFQLRLSQVEPSEYLEVHKI